MVRNTLWFVGTSVCCLVIAASAQAQQVGEQFRRDHNVSVRDRPRPELEPLRIKAGAFTLAPKATASLTTDDNIYATNTNETDDLIGTLIAEVGATTNWSRHDLTANVKVQNDSYQDHSEENATTYAANVSGRLDVQRDFALVGGARFEHDVEARTASGIASTTLAKPVRYDLSGFDLGGARAFNRTRITAAYAYRDIDYDDARDLNNLVVDQDYRDHSTERASLRGDYAVSPNSAFFVKAEGNRRKYDHATSGGFNRDSDGYQITTGVDLDLTGVIRGQAQIGYLSQDFEDPTTSDISGFAASGEIEWFPTQITTVTFRAAREVQDTGLITSPAALNTTGGVQVDHELLRNLLLTGRFEYSNSDYQRIDREDDRTAAIFGVNYLTNRHFNVQLFYSYLKQSSSGVASGVDYTVNRLSVALVAKY
jgi:hypothetical protein